MRLINQVTLKAKQSLHIESFVEGSFRMRFVGRVKHSRTAKFHAKFMPFLTITA